MYNETAKLISQTMSEDEYGDAVVSETETEVFVDLRSITQTEFYQAAAVGFKPEIKFLMADYLDYHGEQFIDYCPYNALKSERYRIIRTYRNGNQLELVCSRGVDQ